MTGTLVAPPKSIDVAFIIAVGLFNAGGYFFMMYGISKLGAAIASFVSMLEPIVSVIFSTLWFHDSGHDWDSSRRWTCHGKYLADCHRRGEEGK